MSLVFRHAGTPGITAPTGPCVEHLRLLRLASRPRSGLSRARQAPSIEWREESGSSQRSQPSEARKLALELRLEACVMTTTFRDAHNEVGSTEEADGSLTEYDLAIYGKTPQGSALAFYRRQKDRLRAGETFRGGRA